ncbi:MAG: sn-glycerol-3-phosphate ABC transporter ATP-binding protein UgpC [Proteobacteria bacterium]|nr:sn-glycerol-3-phosphate ABC transporter ATP-binding protein UgpC [Pseudomonadota bacterium]
MAAIDIEKVVKTYGAFTALRGVSLTIDDGAFVALVGPSGCGKTTLLRSICGLEDIISGEIRIDGKEVTDQPPKDRDIAMVFQSYALYPHMSVSDNMSFSMRLAHAAKELITEKVGYASGILGLGDYLERLPRQLSGGQRQRVAMGRAIVRNPKAFLFDEPLSNLDAKLRVQMRKEIKQLHQRLGVTSVFVTHDQIEAMTLADRVVVMNAGNIEQAGSPLDLYDHPANTFVAGFIGSPAMNMLEGNVVRGDGAPRFVLPDGGTLPLPVGADLADGAGVIFGVRPEHVHAAATDDGARATVNVVEPTGFETFLYSTLGDTEVCIRSTDRLAFRPDDEIGFVPDPEHVHLFDPETGRRLN